MEISEVHKRVHFELEENVSAVHRERMNVFALVYMLPINCHLTITQVPFPGQHRFKTVALYVSKQAKPQFTLQHVPFLPLFIFLFFTFINHEAKQSNRKLNEEGKEQV